ncbi:MAG: hypothetical protein EOO85_16335 [Pedobacter sp.]|nr:MAG: hypothetical protein EOO85_16335 [Pedobacter sp.]
MKSVGLTKRLPISLASEPVISMIRLFTFSIKSPQAYLKLELSSIKKFFRVVKHFKPPSSREDSAESYVVATGFHNIYQMRK